MSSKAAILEYAPQTLTPEDKDLGWIVGEWKSRNKKRDGVEWSEIVDSVSTANRTRIIKYMHRDDFTQHWLKYLAPQNANCFMRLVEAAENFCYQESQARKRKREHFIKLDHNNAQPSLKRTAMSSSADGNISVMQLVKKQLTMKSAKDELRPLKHVLLQNGFPIQTKKDESKQNAAAATVNQRVKIREEIATNKKHQNNAKLEESGTKQKRQNDTKLERWDPSKYHHLCPKPLGSDIMELAFLLEHARLMKAPSIWDHVNAYMSDSLAALIRQYSDHPHYKKKRLELIVGKLNDPRRDDFESFRNNLREERLKGTLARKTKIINRDKPKNAISKSASLRQSNHFSEANVARTNTLEDISSNAKAVEKYSTLHTWSFSKWKDIMPEILQQHQGELAFLLVQAQGNNYHTPWEHVSRNMSDALSNVVRIKSQSHSFTKNRLEMIVGRKGTPERCAFDNFKRIILQSLPKDTLEESREKVMKKGGGEPNHAPNNQCFHIQKRKKSNNPHFGGIALSQSQYEEYLPKGLTREQMELAFLLEQARSAKASVPWKHVYSQMSEALAKIVHTKSKNRSFDSNRMEMLVGRKGSRIRRVFDRFQNSLRPELREATSESALQANKSHALKGSEKLSTKQSLDGFPPHWNVGKWAHLCPQNLPPEIIELAFLLEQAHSLDIHNCWTHVELHMSKALSALFFKKSQLPSFRQHRLALLAGELHQSRRQDFEVFRRALRDKALANVPVEPVPAFKLEVSESFGLNTLGKIQNEKVPISKAELPKWDASQYEGLYSESLRAEQLELAFLFEQARSIKASSLWSHVNAYKSNTLAKWLEIESQSPQFQNKRLGVLVGDLTSPIRKDFETFRSILREMPNQLKFVKATKESHLSVTVKQSYKANSKHNGKANNIAKLDPSLKKFSVPVLQGLETQLENLCPENLDPEEIELAFLLEQARHKKIRRSWDHVEKYMSDALASLLRSKCSIQTLRKQGPGYLISRIESFNLFRRNLQDKWFNTKTAEEVSLPKRRMGDRKTISLMIATQGIIISKCEARIGKSFMNCGASNNLSKSQKSSKQSKRSVEYREGDTKSTATKVHMKPKTSAKVPKKGGKTQFLIKKNSNHNKITSVPVWVGPPDEDLGRKWPDGWIKKVFLRKRGATKGGQDNYWFSPISEKKFRSILEVKRFLTFLKKSKGDEDVAWGEFKEMML